MTRTKLPMPARRTSRKECGLDEFVSLLDTADRAGINSVRKLKMFIKFSTHEGTSMSELAGKSKTSAYTEVQQALIELSSGRYNAARAPKLVTLGRQESAKPGIGRRKPIKLTARGRRLFERIEEFCGDCRKRR